MAILPGYEYDVFISYRHNDNRSGWVTEFVNALREELSATIKEPLSIYFYQNPHDGLLETHNVDKSLEGKLNCLIFIPITSQTYCDLKVSQIMHFRPRLVLGQILVTLNGRQVGSGRFGGACIEAGCCSLTSTFFLLTLNPKFYDSKIKNNFLCTAPRLHSLDGSDMGVCESPAISC